MNRDGGQYPPMWNDRFFSLLPGREGSKRGWNRAGLRKNAPGSEKHSARPGSSGPELSAGLLTEQSVRERYRRTGNKKSSSAVNVKCWAPYFNFGLIFKRNFARMIMWSGLFFSKSLKGRNSRCQSMMWPFQDLLLKPIIRSSLAHPATWRTVRNQSQHGSIPEKCPSSRRPFRMDLLTWIQGQ